MKKILYLYFIFFYELQESRIIFFINKQTVLMRKFE
jgi:hypothetical protein